MAVPNHIEIVKQVNRDYPHLLQWNSASACGEFLQRVVAALPKEERWGLLTKTPGENGYTFPNGIKCSYDYVAVPQGDRIDIIQSAAGHDEGFVGGPGWTPAAPHEWREQNHWVDITDWPLFISDAPQTDQGPVTNQCELSFGWFCWMRAFADWPDEAERNLNWIMKEIDPHSFRVMLAVEGQSHGSPDVWRDAGVFIDGTWDDRYKRMLDRVGEMGRKVHATVYGGRNQTPTESDRNRFHDRIVAASEGRWQAIRSFEMMNEFQANYWTAAEVRAAGRDLRSKLPSGFLLSLSSPSSAHGMGGPNPTNEEMTESFDELYGGDGAGANEITIHTMRDVESKWSDPFSFNQIYPGWRKINNEPPGPGSSAGGMWWTGEDVARDFSNTIGAGWVMYVGHAEWCVWNGHLPQEYHNGWREIRNVWELPNMPQCAAAMKSLNTGTIVPPSPKPQPPVQGSGELRSGQSLGPDESLWSVGGHADLRYQSDGNVVSYLEHQPHWSSQTEGQSLGRLEMTTDGDLVLFNAEGPIRWTRTKGHPGAMVQIQDDGNFVVYEDPNGPNKGKALWASATDPFYDSEA